MDSLVHLDYRAVHGVSGAETCGVGEGGRQFDSESAYLFVVQVAYPGEHVGKCEEDRSRAFVLLDQGPAGDHGAGVVASQRRRDSAMAAR